MIAPMRKREESIAWLMPLWLFSIAAEESCAAQGQHQAISLLQAKSVRTRHAFHSDPAVPQINSNPYPSLLGSNGAAQPASISSQAYIYAPISKADEEAVENSSFHKAVGKDGVLMITLPDRGGYNYCVDKLRAVGIDPVTFRATDGRTATKDDVAPGCIVKDLPQSLDVCDSREGVGCVNIVEAAIANSHRRALEMALTRTENWTAIFEDDAVPVGLPEGNFNWDVEFKQAWERRPPIARIVRLSWCSGLGVVQQTEPNSSKGGRFQWLQLPIPTGGCTAAYMVHKEIIPRMLKVFPCCGAVDACYQWDLFKKAGASNVLFNLVADGADAYIKGHSHSPGVSHHGVMMPAGDVVLPTTRVETKSVRSDAGLQSRKISSHPGNAPCKCEADSADWVVQKGRPPKCIFIDLGAANGNSFQSFLNNGFGNVSNCPSNGSFEAILVEANPKFAKPLMQLQSDFNGAVRSVTSAAYMCEGTTNFYLDTKNVAQNNWGSSLSPNARDVLRSGKRHVMVPLINVPRLIVESTIPEDHVLVKMDIEGAEHDIIPCLVQSRATQLIDALYVEKHPKEWSLANTGPDALRQSLDTLRREGIAVPEYNSPTF